MERSEFNQRISESIIKIGKNIKSHRIELKLTQQELAYRAGNIERSTISNIERFQCNGITLGTLIKISSVLKIDVCELFK